MKPGTEMVWPSTLWYVDFDVVFALCQISENGVDAVGSVTSSMNALLPP